MWGIEGQTDFIVDRMRAAGAGSGTIVEIGTGTGRYLHRLIGGATRYESYETAPDWEWWLGKTYPVATMQADGKTLSGTPDASVDLAHAHGVFVYTPFLTSVSYWREIVRVLKPGGLAVFDIFTHDCMGAEEIAAWHESGADHPVVHDADFALSFLPGLSVVDSFKAGGGARQSRYFVLRKG